MWRSQFEADPKIIGNPITLDMRPYTVVGVMPAEFRTPFFDQADQLWIPLVQDPLFSGWMTHPPQTHWMPVFARLRPEVSFAQAKAEMDTLSARLAEEFPAERGWVIQQVQPLQQAVVGDVKTPLLILSCAVGLVLLIACANIANLLLTRATSRSKEIAVRIALGAHRHRITRQLLTESAMLGIFGSMAGMLLAYWGVSALISVLPPGLPRIHTIHVDGSVLGFALVLSLGARTFRRTIRSADKPAGGRSGGRNNRLAACSQLLGRRRGGAGNGSSCRSRIADAQLRPAYLGQPRF
jgi:putative ABC transport system permease protein